MPSLVGPANEFRDRVVARRAQRYLAHDGEKLWFIVVESAKTLEVRSQHGGRPPAHLERRAEPPERVADNASDQRLLGGEVVVERRDIHPDGGGDITRPQSLEAPLRQ